MVKPVRKKVIADRLVETYEVSNCRVFRLMQLCLLSYNYQPVKKDERAYVTSPPFVCATGIGGSRCY